MQGPNGKRKIAVIKSSDRSYSGDDSEFIAQHITEWVEISDEEYNAVLAWVNKQNRSYSGYHYRILQYLTPNLNIPEILKEAKELEKKRDEEKREKERKQKEKKENKEKKAIEEKRKLFEQLKKELEPDETLSKKGK